MKKVLKSILISCMISIGVFWMLPRVSAGGFNGLTPLGQETFFKAWFKNISSKCSYDKEFAIEVDKFVGEAMYNSLYDYGLKSMFMVYGYHKGVCRDFAFCVSNELTSWKIENYLIAFPKHFANLYISPVNGKIMVADLTREINYKNDPDYNQEYAMFSAVPLNLYIKTFFKEISCQNIYVLDTNSGGVRSLSEYLISQN